MIRRKGFWWSGFYLVLATSFVRADDPTSWRAAAAPPPNVPRGLQPVAYQGAVPDPAPAAQPVYLAQPADIGLPPNAVCPGSVAPFTPFMLGDFGAIVANLPSDFKVAEGESPRPVDRVFFKFNYFNNIDKDRFEAPTSNIHNVELYRSVIGFEKTFLDGRFSMGLRVPSNSFSADGKDSIFGPAGPSESGTEFGNISAVVKGVMFEDKAAGVLVSAGATVSFPTATSFKINPGPSIITYVQPFGGFILQRGDFYVQGFSSITIPLLSVESVLLFNSLGVGYFVYRDRSGAGWIKSIAPTLEVHVLTPIRQPSAVTEFGFTDDLLLKDTVDLTLGATVEVGRSASLGVGFVTPLTGPKPFDFEILAQLNYRF